MDEHHVGHAVANLVERCPDVVAEGQRIVFGSMTGAPASEDDRGSFGHGRTALGLGPGAQEIAPFDERGSQHGAVIEARTGDRLPGGTELVEVEAAATSRISSSASIALSAHCARSTWVSSSWVWTSDPSAVAISARTSSVARSRDVDLRSRSGGRC
jgi:hypothetical protein